MKVAPKKHLGQHFLKDENIAQRIVTALQANAQTKVLEVGPGTGVLTKYLIEKDFEQFQALDVDAESVEYLKKNYPEHSDKFLLADFLNDRIEGEKVAIIGNFPYNISSQIFFKVWDNRHAVNEVVGMIQKEVADRICSKHGNKVYGILSVLLGAFYDIEYLFEVPPSVFNPPPKVDSAVIRLVRNDRKELSCDEKLFKRVVKMGFGKRRKTLRNALKELNLPKEETEAVVFSKRAEQLSVADFEELTLHIQTICKK